jgi:hypothetical protein
MEHKLRGVCISRGLHFCELDFGKVNFKIICQHLSIYTSRVRFYCLQHTRFLDNTDPFTLNVEVALLCIPIWAHRQGPPSHFLVHLVLKRTGGDLFKYEVGTHDPRTRARSRHGSVLTCRYVGVCGIDNNATHTVPSHEYSMHTHIQHTQSTPTKPSLTANPYNPWI